MNYGISLYYYYCTCVTLLVLSNPWDNINIQELSLFRECPWRARVPFHSCDLIIFVYRGYEHEVDSPQS